MLQRRHDALRDKKESDNSLKKEYLKKLSTEKDF
jgi:hypothetical protein